MDIEQKVKDYDGLYRAPSGAIVNKNMETYSKFIAEKERALANERRINNIESELSEIKDLLKQLLKV